MKPITLSALVFALVLLDRATKIIAEKWLPENGPVALIGEYFRLNLAHNFGIAFSIPITGIFLKIMTVLLIGYVMYYYGKEELNRWKFKCDIGYALVFSGAFGNAYDRILIGKVTDFLDLKYFAIFNVADMMLTIGAAWLIAYHLHERNRVSKSAGNSGR